MKSTEDAKQVKSESGKRRSDVRDQEFKAKEAKRWDSARGWDGLSWKERRKKEKELEAEHKRARERFREEETARRAIEVRSLGDWMSPNDEGGMLNDESGEIERLAQPIELFPPFWGAGELAVLMGPSGSGKSRLAMQIASLAGRTSNHENTRTDTNEERSTVLYLDLERTERQYRERYSAPGLMTHVDLGLLGDVATPERFRGKRHKFLLAAVNEKLRLGHSVVIIDNVTWLIKADADEIRSLMKGFRRWVNETGNSLLLLSHSSLGRPLDGQLAKFELADSVFALTSSTMGSDIRYVKALFSTRHEAPLFGSDREVLVLKKGQDGFMPIGVSREREHYRDYASEIEAREYLAAGAAKLLPALMPAVIPRRVTFLGIS